MSSNIGLIGCGNMGRAMIGGIIKSGLLKPENIVAADLFKPCLESAQKEFGINTTTSNTEVAKSADILILSVKPIILKDVIKEIKDVVKKDCIIISIIAGKTLYELESGFGDGYKIVRTMPNTPALVGAGMSALCPNKNINDQDLKKVKSIFESFGKVEVLEERLIDAFVSLSGSSPAYVFMFIEAMADAAVLDGIPRDKAYRIASQAVLGSAKMVLETEKHPGELKDIVCSPSGTTIEAVAELENRGFRAAVISAMRKCTEKCKAMSK